ncbi:MAG: hypothetical protein RL458_284 [Pseudomonadota bacterium]|jgi:hypothetical protein
MAPNRRGTQSGPALDCRDIHEYQKGLNDMLNRLLLYIGMACLLLAGGGGLACASDGFVIRRPESVLRFHATNAADAGSGRTTCARALPFRSAATREESIRDRLVRSKR